MLFMRSIVDSATEHIQHTAIHMLALVRADLLIQRHRIAALEFLNRTQSNVPEVLCDAFAHTRNFLKGFQYFLLCCWHLIVLLTELVEYTDYSTDVRSMPKNCAYVLQNKRLRKWNLPRSGYEARNKRQELIF